MFFTNEKWWYRFKTIILAILLLAVSVGLLVPTAAQAAGGSLTISGEGLKNPGGITITQQQLRGNEPLPQELQIIHGHEYLQQHKVLYSTINTWPTKSWYRGEGPLLTDLLNLAGGLTPEATQIRFVANDGFKATFTVQELLEEPRYRFPNFINYEDRPDHLFGHVPGDPSGAVQVEPIIAHQSYSSQDLEDMEGPDADDNFSRNDANHLLYGQRAVTQQTNARFAKYTVGIEVLIEPALKWDNPTASVAPGEVEVGTEVRLESPYNDEDKVHYTLDGSVPTIESPMYNWIAKRWWSSRVNELDQINKPIVITGDTTIKAFVTGPGRADSDVVTFEYTVPRVDVTGVEITPEGARELEVGGTVQLTAVVEPENATDKSVTWSSSDENVAAVDETGLVTAVAAGSAVITATTNDGGFTDNATIIVKEPATEQKPVYTVAPVADDVYTIGTTPDGISTMTVNSGKAGFRYVTVSITPNVSGSGNETAVFTHTRNGSQLSINATVADFDQVNTAQAGFNVEAGDVIKVYIVDELTNAADRNPVILQ